MANVVGAEPSHLRVGVALQALWISLAAVLASWVLVAVFRVGSVLLVAGSWPRFTGWTVAAVALNAAIVIVVSVFAAWLPVARLGYGNVAAGLASRVEYRTPSIRNALAGLGLVMTGLALLRGTVGGEGVRVVGLGLLGAVSLMAGAVVAMPWLIDQLVSVATSRSAAGRLAIRGLNAHRHRSVGLILVVGSVVALATAGLTDNAGSQHPDYGSQYGGQLRSGEVVVEFGHPDPDQNVKIIQALEALGPSRVMEYSDPSSTAASLSEPWGSDDL